MPILSRLDETIKKYSFTEFSYVKAQKPLSFNVYEQWLQNEYQGDMDYLVKQKPLKSHLNNILPQCQSAIVVLQNYYPHPRKLDQDFPLKNQRIAKYAQGEDYHFWFKDSLKKLINELQEQFPEEHFLACTDSQAILERDLAQQAGLGWFGKNTCLLNQQQGSFFFIGEVLTSLNLPGGNQVHPDLCGNCNRCVEACPTQALLPGKTLDATKCISYWNIESKSLPPEGIRNKMQDWLFGCDICQDVCPWNQKVFATDFQHKPAPVEDIANELKWILNNSNKFLEKTLKPTPLNRARAKGLKRTALIVAANLELKQLLPEIKSYCNHETLGPMAEWALAELS